MDKVIIVEDDRIIRRSLSRAPWKEHGFILAGEAADGESALELIEREQPHVVVSDISMPFMNGLDMARVIKETSPHTKVIFLTGYEDFKYAQEAVQLKAFDYLLKPVKIDDLIEKVKKAAAECNQEMTNERRFVESLPLLQQRFLRKLANQDGATIVDIEKELADLDVQLEGPFYNVLLINVNEEEKAQVTETISEMPSNGSGYLLNGEMNEMVLLLSLDTDDGEREKKLAVDILEQLKAQLENSVTITIGRTYRNLFEISTSFVESRLAMDMKHIMGTSRVYSIDDTIPCTMQNVNILNELNEEFNTQIRLESPLKVKETLEKLCEAITDNKNIPLSEIKLLALKYSTSLYYQIKKWKKGEEESLSMTVLFDHILQLESLHEMSKTLQGLVDEWSDSMDKEKNLNHNSLVDNAMAYMNENFHDLTLTQQKVADKVFVSAPYLSNLFKLEKGLNFGDYLLELRITKAMELLRDQNAKVYKVAESVGYSNPQYFGVCFKKYTGHTPGEYRKSVLA
ncbi:response regulator [Sporosarcina sp. Marseille-Q4063]|uniref:response regulator n=1 Tax=Sporosarcina sp. Marseille-Q4063 TaxID=2810514 RepID=UPI001BB05F2B|nr:response regulator [Sporosarcina sp. Marseille-Q4063]QUW21558.1 response regulator [Sporosarcina sp. Marseille-Q4063]